MRFGGLYTLFANEPLNQPIGVQRPDIKLVEMSREKRLWPSDLL